MDSLKREPLLKNRKRLLKLNFGTLKEIVVNVNIYKAKAKNGKKLTIAETNYVTFLYVVCCELRKRGISLSGDCYKASEIKRIDGLLDTIMNDLRNEYYMPNMRCQKGQKKVEFAPSIKWKEYSAHEEKIVKHFAYLCGNKVEVSDQRERKYLLKPVENGVTNDELRLYSKIYDKLSINPRDKNNNAEKQGIVECNKKAIPPDEAE